MTKSPDRGHGQFQIPSIKEEQKWQLSLVPGPLFDPAKVIELLKA